MNLSIIIPNYNGEALLRKNLPKVLNELASYKEHKSEVIVVDDGSIDSSILYLEKLVKGFKNLRFFVNNSNLGFSSTVNRGVKESNGEVIILLNSDVYPEENFLKPLLSHFNDDKVFAVGCLDKSMEGDRIVLRGRGLGEWKKRIFNTQKRRS